MRALVLFAFIAGCSSGPSNVDAGRSTGCVADFSGRVEDHAEAQSCATLEMRDAGNSLHLELRSPAEAATLQVSIALGQKSSGVFTEATTTDWSAVSIDNANCLLVAGSTAVPTGSFRLQHDSADGQPHGRLTVLQHVQAPAGVSCGPGDSEQIVVSF